MTYEELIKRTLSLENVEFMRLFIQGPMEKVVFDAMMDADQDTYDFESKYEKIIYNDTYGSLCYDWDDNNVGRYIGEPSVEEKEKYIKSTILATAYFRTISRITEEFDKRLMSILDD